MPVGSNLIKSSSVVVRIAWVANRIFLAAVATGLLLTLCFSARFTSLVAQLHPARDVHSVRSGLWLLMLLGIAMAVATEILLSTLAQIIATASVGDPFIAANAQRLQTIGWTLLALQLLDLPGALIDRFFPSLGSAAPDVSFSPGGWIAVLMVFVLSRVFASGTAMKEDLEGTV